MGEKVGVAVRAGAGVAVAVRAGVKTWCEILLGWDLGVLG